MFYYTSDKGKGTFSVFFFCFLGGGGQFLVTRLWKDQSFQNGFKFINLYHSCGNIYKYESKWALIPKLNVHNYNFCLNHLFFYIVYYFNSCIYIMYIYLCIVLYIGLKLSWVVLYVGLIALWIYILWKICFILISQERTSGSIIRVLK